MTREEILKLALDAGGRMYSSDEVDFFLSDLERFAKLIYETTFQDANIAASRTIIDAAVLHEREACAKVCEETTAAWTQHLYNSGCMDCAAAIRARGYT